MSVFYMRLQKHSIKDFMRSASFCGYMTFCIKGTSFCALGMHLPSLGFFVHDEANDFLDQRNAMVVLIQTGLKLYEASVLHPALSTNGFKLRQGHREALGKFV